MNILIIKIISLIGTLILGGIVIADTIKLHKLKKIMLFQHHIIELYHNLNQELLKQTKQEKCYGSTMDSKLTKQGSTSCSCAAIMKELTK